MKKRFNCIDCNVEVWVNGSRCRNCYNKFYRGENHPSWTGGVPKCLDCNTQVGDRYSKRCASCSYKQRFGSGNPNWKGGIKNRYMADRTSRKYIEWRMKVFTRDGFACHLCGDCKGGNLVAHHILTFNNFPSMRFNVGNGVTLCKDCHKKLHKSKSTFWIADRWFWGVGR